MKLLLIYVTGLCVSLNVGTTLADCPDPLPEKPSAEIIRNCLAEAGKLRKEMDTLKRSAVSNDVVTAQCSGNCNDLAAARAQCPPGKRMISGVWYYSAPDVTPSVAGPWSMCYNNSGKCPDAGSNYCTTLRAPPDPDRACARPQYNHEVGWVVAVCASQ